MICASCGAENREGARFCDACGAALAAESGREQRKVVTVLFCDVSGSTAFAESRDPEAVRAVMARYFEVARTAIERHGGTLEKFIGDAVMAVFGVPVVREDDALRAVRAAAELRDEVELDVRIGVNTGGVVTGAGDALVTGDAVNVAARLEQAAAPGEVLLGEGTYRLVRDAVDAELLPPLAAKGKSEPLTVYRLRAVTGDVAFARRLDAPLVGRGRERRLLEGAFERSRSERACSLFTILGTAGVGKSRLAAEFLAGLERACVDSTQARQATVVSGRCLSYGEGITYWPVVEVVLRLLCGEPPPNAALAALLGDGQAPTDEIAFAVRKLLESHAAERPLVVVFDDLQWAEPTFLDLIEHVADWSRDAPILLLCLARPELLERREGWGGGKLNATTVLLESLSAAETDELIDSLLAGERLDDSLRTRIREAADGNPLFVEQMLAVLHESAGEVTVPSTIQALLAARLDQLPPLERAALERGAVEGQVFHRGAVVALDGDAGSLLPLVRKELVRPSEGLLPGDDAFRFRHLLIRDAAYDALPKTARADLHERFAAWLDERAPELVELDEIAGYHLEQAAFYRRELGRAAPELAERAATRLAAAAERAAVRHDAHAAAKLSDRAAQLLPECDERHRLRLEYARALHALGRHEELFAVLDEIIDRAGPDRAAEAFCWRALVALHAESVSPTETARAVRERLAGLGPDADPRTLATVHLTLAWASFVSGRLGDARESAEQTAELARTAKARDLEREALQLLFPVIGRGDVPIAELERWADELTRLGVDLRSAGVIFAGHTGRVEEARRLSEDYLRDAHERGRLVEAYAHGCVVGELEVLFGDLERALAALRAAWEGLGALGEQGFRSTVGAQYASVLARAGALDAAEEVLTEVDAIASPDDWLTVCRAAIARGWVAARRGDEASAVEYLRQATALADAREDFVEQMHTSFEVGEISLVLGRHGEAATALGRARAMAVRKGSTATVDRIDALLATPAAAPPA